ncbi:hypothetical protein, partial [Parabacteroides sp.]
RFGAGGPPAGRFFAVLGLADRLPGDFSPFWSRRAACRLFFSCIGDINSLKLFPFRMIAYPYFPYFCPHTSK